MNISRYGLSLLGSGLIAAMVVPVAAQAQQAPYGYGYNSYPQQGYGQAPAYPQQGYQYPQEYQYQQPQYQGGYPQQRYPATSPDGYPIPGSSYQGNQGYQGNPEYEAGFPSPLDFIPGLGRRVGQAIRRAFYGDGRNGYHQEPSPYDGGGIHNGDLDRAPPPYSSHYDSQPPPRQQQQPRYQSPTPPAYQEQPQPSPRYQTPPAQQQVQPPAQQRYQTPSAPTNRYVPPTLPNSRSGSTLPAPKKSSPTKSTTTSTPPPAKKSDPVLTGKSSKSRIQDSPPTDKPQDTRTQYAPPPSSEPKSTPPTKQDSVASKSSSSSSGSSSFLKGKRTSKTGRVISPYPPYQELDVTGLSSGSLAMDPTTQKVFEVP